MRVATFLLFCAALLPGSVRVVRADIAQYRTNVLAEPGLVSLYTFEASDAADAVGPNPGTLAGTTGFTPGAAGFGTALLLGGAGHVQLGNVAAFDFTSGLGTIEAWVRADWSSVGYNPCLFSDRDGNPVRWSAHMNADKGAFGIWNGSTYPPAAIAGAGTTWHHLAIVFSNNTVRLYWDASLVGTTSQGLGGGSVPTQLGSSSANTTTEGWIGALDEVAFYSTALSGSRIAAHYYAIYGSDPPAFTLQPRSLFADEGMSASFRAAVSPPIGVSLQWQRNGTNLPNATNASITLSNLALPDNGAQFRAIATNLYGATTSAVATLILTSTPPNMVYYRSAVQAEPSLLAYFPVDDTTGTTVTNIVRPAFSGTLSGGATLDRNADRLVGRRAIGQNGNGWTALARDPAYEFPSGSGTIELFLYQSAGGGYNPAFFACRTNNSTAYGDTLTRYSLHGAAGGAVIMLWTGSALVSWPVPLNMIGNFVHVAVVFDGGLTTVYFNGASLGSRSVSLGAHTGLPIQIGAAGPSTQEAWPGTLDEVALYGAALPAQAIAAHYSAYLSTTLGVAPVIVQQPQSLVLNEGTPATFTLTLADAAGAVYRWQRDGIVIPGATNATLTLPDVTLDDDGAQFRCIVYNPFGGTNSAAATLEVFDANPPRIVGVNTLEDTTTVLVTLSEAVSTNGAVITLGQGATVLGIGYGLASNILVLTTTPLAAGTDYTLTASGLTDSAGNSIAPGTTASFKALTYEPLDPTFLRGQAEPPGPATRRGPVIVSEIMYHPADRADGRNGEFIELYNSNPWPEDLGGFRLSGEWDYVFPAGVRLDGYLLVAASPDDVTAIYGVTNVLGGFTNRLNNAGGVLRLHNELGAVVFEVEYGTQPPWPAAADGAGHSLVLARPSQGMGSPRAWAASQLPGGSPGGPDLPVAVDGGRDAVFINEFFANSAPPDLDFIELFNASTNAVDLGGCFLSDDPATNKFQIPANTTLPPLGHAVFDEAQLGFALGSDGETVFFRDRDGRRVLDAARFDGQQEGVAMGRFPDGAPEFSRLQTRTPGAPNSRPRASDVVINEVMYHPITGDNGGEFLELHNRGASPVDIGNWRLDGGVSFTLPTGLILAPGAFLAVANNLTQLRATYPALSGANSLGNFSGQLSNGGERIRLRAVETTVTTNALGQVATNFLRFTVHEVAYGTGGRWGAWNDGGGSSLELVEARADARLAPAWADSDETARNEWKSIEVSGLVDNGTGAADQLQLLLQGPGECLVDDVTLGPSGSASRVTNGDFESGANGWVFQGTHWQSTVVDGVGLGGSKCLHVRASERGDTGANRIFAPLTSALTSGQTVTLRAKVRWLKGWPEILFRVRGSWFEAPVHMLTTTALGTPGAPNSRALTNAGPAIVEVTHRPALPAEGEPVTVFARVSDPDGLAGAALRYRLDPNSRLTTVNMVPRGAGWFSAPIPPQTANVLAAFQVVAQDKPGAVSAFPADAPARECLVRWGEPPATGRLGAYRFWMTRATQTRWEQREKNSNEPLDVTFVNGQHRIIYNAGALYSGSPFHTGGFTGPNGANCDYVLTFPPDDPMLGETWMMLAGPGTFGDDLTLIREQIIWWMAREIGVPALNRRFVRVFVNGQPRQTVFEDTQQPNGDFYRQWVPEDGEGDLFKAQDWIEFADNGASFLSDIRATLQKYTSGSTMPPKRYRWMWAPRSVAVSANDFTNLFTLVEILNLADTPLFTAQTAALVDTENWSRALAIQRISGNWDSWGWSYGKNMYAYKPRRGPWIMTPWDIDFCFGTDGLTGGNPASDTPTAGLFSNGSNWDGGAPGDTIATKFRNNPEFQRAYWRAFQDAVNGPMLAAAANARIDSIVSALQAEGLTPYSANGVKSYISQRRAYLVSQLATVNAPFAISANGGNDFATNRGAIRLAGSAPIEVQSVRVNGAAYPVTWTSVTNWSLLVPLEAGSNALALQGFDVRGNPLPAASDSIGIEYTGTNASPSDHVVFNELMYNSSAPEATFVELFNTSTDTSFDLSGWRLEGLGYTFPPGAVLTNGGLMLLAKNRGAFANTYGPAIPVFGQFDRELDNGGETLSLIQPGATPAQDVVVDRVRYDNNAPWPATADGQGWALQLVDPAQDNSRVANWSDGLGWRFFSYTGPSGTAVGSRLSLYMDTTGGDVFIDDLSLTLLTGTNAGLNVIKNGGFELPLGTNTVLGPNNWLTNIVTVDSEIVTNVQRGGSSCLHFLYKPASAQLTQFYQDLAPTIPTQTVCQLSFWYLPGTNGANLNLRMTSSFFPKVAVRPPAPATPGTTNSVAGLLAVFPPLWLNEAQPENTAGPLDAAGDRDPWIELYNSGPTNLSLEGFLLSDNYTNLARWAFPAGAFIEPGQFLVVFADGETNETAGSEYHTGFRLNPGSGSVALSRLLEGAPQLLDYLNYEGIPAGLAYGSLPDGQPFYRQLLHTPTPGAGNSDARPPVTVFINEWMAVNNSGLIDLCTSAFEDWFELYNPAETPADLGGLYLTDDLANRFQFEIPQGYVVPPHGFLLVWADNQASCNRTNDADLHVNFRLGAGGESIALIGRDGAPIDLVSFGVQAADVSQGRYPDGSASVSSMSTPTPRQPNTLSVAPEEPTLGGAGFSDQGGGQFTFAFGTQTGVSYRVEYKEDFAAPQWTVEGTYPGTGGLIVIANPVAGVAQRFYRVVLVQ